MINLEDFLAVGQNAIARRVVQQSDCADNYENDFKGLLSTPRLIHWHSMLPSKLSIRTSQMTMHPSAWASASFIPLRQASA